MNNTVFKSPTVMNIIFLVYFNFLDVFDMMHALFVESRTRGEPLNQLHLNRVEEAGPGAIDSVRTGKLLQNDTSTNFSVLCAATSVMCIIFFSSSVCDNICKSIRLRL